MMQRRHFALIDDRLVEDTLLVRRSLGTPALKSPDPVVNPGEALGSVLRDKDGQWRMWYNFFVARDPEKDMVGCDTLLGLALSDDGVHWAKPSLGLVEEAGTRDNNIVIGARHRDANGRYLTGYGGPSGFCVIDAETDPHPQARSRFTAMYLASVADSYGGICLAHSDDGLHWTAYPENPVIPGNQDTQNCLLYDPRLGKYVCFQRPMIYCGVKQHANRKMARVESEDLIHWSPSRVVLDTDERDAPAFDTFDEPGMGGWIRGRNRQFQGMTPFFVNDCYVAHTWFYDVTKGIFTDELIHSDDGIRWWREPLRESFVADGRPAGFHGLLPVPMGSPPVPVGDELWFYYSNTPHGHHEVAEADIDPSVPNRQALLETNSIYLLAIQRDRWISYDAGELEGELLTRPFDWEGGGSLYLNVAIGADGYLDVSFEDQWSRPVPDYHLDEIPRVNGPLDAVGHRLTFGPGPKTIVKLPPVGPVRLRLLMKNAKLFGWALDDPNCSGKP